MPEPIYLTQTDFTPKIILDKEKGIFLIKGRSIMEDAIEFYMPLINWFREYAKNPNPTTEFIVDYEYLNSSSTRKVLNIFIELENIKATNSEVKIVWMYEETDDIMMEKGEELECVLDVDFEIREIMAKE